MSNREKLIQVMALQGVNAEIERHRKDRQALGLDIEGQKGVLQRAEARLKEAHAGRLEAQKEADALELKIREAEEHIDKLQIQLNMTKQQDDYDTIKKSILGQREIISRWEDAGLELMERVEDSRRDEAGTKEQIEAEKQKLALLEQEVAKQTADYDARIAELTERSAGLREEIDPKVLAAYQRLRPSRGDTALVVVRNRICQGCHNLITKQSEVLLLQDEKLVICNNCGRLLMLPDEVQ